MAATFGNLLSRKISTETDYLGRWIITKFGGSNGRRVNSIVTYNCCKTSLAKAGPGSYPNQQYAAFTEEGRENISPRWNHARDLKKVIEKLQAAGELVIMGGDFNEKVGDESNGMAMVVTGVRHFKH